MDAVLIGLVAGYGIAIPVGAISVLIVEVGLKCGFRCGFSAGAGAATADLTYAIAAIAGGAAIGSVIESVGAPFRYASAAALAVMAVLGLRRLRNDNMKPTDLGLPQRGELIRTYLKFLGLTIINPLTVVYFTAFIVGLGLTDDLPFFEGVVFVIAAFLASLSWQTLLAGLGAVGRHKLSSRFRIGTVLLGNLFVLGLAITIAMTG